MEKKASASTYNREWRKKNADYDRARKRQYYLENRAKLVEKAKARLAETRQQDGPKYRPDISRSYVIAEGRVYFNSRLGFSEEEILEIALKMRLAAKDEAKRIVSGDSGSKTKSRRSGVKSRGQDGVSFPSPPVDDVFRGVHVDAARGT